MILLIGLLSSWATPAVRVPIALRLCDSLMAFCLKSSTSSILLIATETVVNSSRVFRTGTMGANPPLAIRCVELTRKLSRFINR